MPKMRRRDLLTGSALALLGSSATRAGLVSGQMPWAPNAGVPPVPAKAGPWEFFTADEAAMVEALADRIIPPDPETFGGKDAGCAVFLDRQLAGPFGRDEGLYDSPPFIQGAKNQGRQTPKNRGEMYRAALAALDRHCRANGGKRWTALPPERQDEILEGLESGKVALEGLDGVAFFADLVKDMQEGFFADPLYGGNRDMCSWKMIGFPGAHYDYSDWVDRHNERYPHPPVSIQGRREWGRGR